MLLAWPAGIVDKAKELGIEGLEEKARAVGNVSLGPTAWLRGGLVALHCIQVHQPYLSLEVRPVVARDFIH